jgi:hypothetical protein
VFPMNRKAIENPVTIEYNSRGKRVRKVLSNAIEARQFYCRKLREGRNPAVVAKSVG